MTNNSVENNSMIKEAVDFFSEKKYAAALSKIIESEIDASIEIHSTYDVINDKLEDLISAVRKMENFPRALHLLENIRLIDTSLIDGEDNKAAVKKLNIAMVDESLRNDLIEFKEAYYHMIDRKEYFLKTKSGTALYGNGREICLCLMNEYNLDRNSKENQI